MDIVKELLELTNNLKGQIEDLSEQKGQLLERIENLQSENAALRAAINGQQTAKIVPIY